MEYVVYVLDKDGSPLMPTKRFGWVRRALRDGRAVKAKAKPFTIRLTYEPETHVVQEVMLGVKPGRTNIALSAVDDDGDCLYLAECETCNRDVPKHMARRKQHRQASRRGERLRRKRRAAKCGTTRSLHFRDTRMGSRPDMDIDGAFPRMLPGCSKPVRPKDIINTEARFNNRKRPEGWLTPTATQLLRTHMNLIKEVTEILPVSRVMLGANRYSFMELGAGHKLPAGKYQKGPIYGKENQMEALSDLQEGKCLLCRRKLVENRHHIVPVSKGGSNTLSNLSAVCGKCHDKLHKDADEVEKLRKRKAGHNKKYGALSVINQITPFLADALTEMFPDAAYMAAGYEVKEFRDSHGLEKSSATDAYCLSCMALDAPDGIHEPAGAFHIKQYRRHDRQIVKAWRGRYYYLDGVKVAVNRRKATEADPLTGKEKKQSMDSLEEWYDSMVQSHGEREAEKMRSRLKVRKSARIYNNMGRPMPGSIFRYDGRIYVLQANHGAYIRAYGCGNRDFPRSRCKVIRMNRGLVYTG